MNFRLLEAVRHVITSLISCPVNFALYDASITSLSSPNPVQAMVVRTCGSVFSMVCLKTLKVSSFLYSILSSVYSAGALRCST